MSFAPILVIIWFYIYIDLLIQDRKDKDRTELFVILSLGPLKENWDLDLCIFILLFPWGSFLHNDVTFLVLLKVCHYFFFPIWFTKQLLQFPPCSTQDPGHDTKFCDTPFFLFIYECSIIVLSFVFYFSSKSYWLGLLLVVWSQMRWFFALGLLCY